MTDVTAISPLATFVTFAFAAVVVGGMVLYLALMSKKEKK